MKKRKKETTCQRHRYVPYCDIGKRVCFFCGREEKEGEPPHKPGENIYAVVYQTKDCPRLLGMTHAWSWWAKDEEEIKKEWAERLPKYEIVRIIFIRKGE